MSLYAAAIVAQRVVSGRHMGLDYNAIAFQASSDDEALGRAIRAAKSLFPVEQGYYGHAATACQVSKELQDPAPIHIHIPTQEHADADD